MEEEAKMELKHMCKFCSKSFPCGRSLGGHMRSHLINNNNQSDHHYRRKNERSGSKKGSKPKRGLEYELRGRSRKTWRAADGRNDSPVSSWNSNGQNQRVGSMEIQSDGEEDLKWARRSSRRARYIGINGANNDHKNAYSSVSDVEETEQKDVALSLIMLSMDVGHWGSSFAESSDNNSVFLEEKSSFRANGNMKIYDDTKTNTNKNKNKKKCCVNSGDHVKEQKKLGTRSKEFEKEVKKLEFSGYGYQKNECKVSNVEVSANGFVRNELENKCGIQLANGDSSKRKIDDSFSPETEANSIKKIASFDILDSELWKKDEKKSRFECTTCNKAFVSYQALGGHRASHKKLKGCSGSNHEVSENSSQTEVSPLVNKSLHDQEQAKKVENGNNLKKAQNHECPICFKVFPSGQALGGHKRSHLLASGVATDNSNSQINQGLGTHNPTPQTRNFLDLNLPAPADEEAGASIHGGFKPWWVQDTHKPKPLMGLISN